MIIYLFLTINFVNAYEVDKLTNFAQNLMNEGEYYRAITEFKRINNYFPNDKSYLNNMQKIADCYELGGHSIVSSPKYG